jgi:hypothetical protein
MIHNRVDNSFFSLKFTWYQSVVYPKSPSLSLFLPLPQTPASIFFCRLFTTMEREQFSKEGMNNAFDSFFSLPFRSSGIGACFQTPQW